MSNFLQFTVFGIMLGAGYAIAATGLVVTYTTSGVFNFAQGAVGMIAAFGYWELVSAHHVPIVAALVIVLIVGAVGRIERDHQREVLDRFGDAQAL